MRYLANGRAKATPKIHYVLFVCECGRASGQVIDMVSEAA